MLRYNIISDVFQIIYKYIKIGQFNIILVFNATQAKNETKVILIRNGSGEIFLLLSPADNNGFQHKEDAK